MGESFTILNLALMCWYETKNRDDNNIKMIKQISSKLKAVYLTANDIAENIIQRVKEKFFQVIYLLTINVQNIENPFILAQTTTKNERPNSKQV